VDDPLNKETADLQKRLAELDRERAALLTALEQLKLRSKAPAKPTLPMQTAGNISTTTTAQSNAEKVALFHSLFHGRDDVFPRRWENSKTNKVGYAPACHNEWVRGVCEKPRIKCGNCPNQAFVPVNDEIVRSHLLGRNIANPERAEPFVAGVYPLLTDETCWFLAADFDKHVGSAMRWRSWRHAGKRVCLQPLSVPDPAMGRTSGSFSRNRFPLQRHADSVRI